ncbi:putative cytochrome p450 [Lyophyllum shimeji]|uniref:Cytochrome p450 n=1 Tax=Lyophyllum shimeji TaxID=47721 RepID=A0A9P3PMR3_LYOSH|nr:putative cytochrome p450 [Lyophyllum shimeji]
MSVILVALFCALMLVYRLRRPRYPPLPPGPPADPFIGHLRIAPTSDFGISFYNMGKTYGNLMHLNIFGRITVVVNSVRVAAELMEKRRSSSKYNDRALLRVFRIMGWTENLAFIPYGRTFQRHRRMFKEAFNKKASLNHRPVQLFEARVLAKNLMKEPDNWAKLLTRFSTAVILRIVHGHHVVSEYDPLVKLAEEEGWALTQLGSVGANLLDVFPFLQYMPSWFPGTHYAQFAREHYPKVREMYELPLRDVLERMAQGTAAESVMASQLSALHREGDRVGYTVEDIKGVAATSYIAGAETTASTLFSFMLAMVLHPECQLRAQAELDRVVGTNRLPEFDDRPSLPYLECLLQETFRWNHPLPTGVPHRVTADDVYDGMFIPEGSIIIPNIRGMTWDESLYADPFTFDPTRFLPMPEGRNEPFSGATWGFGRRVCPGRHLADASLWIAIAMLLSTVQISKAVDEDGNEIMPEVAFITSFTR